MSKRRVVADEVGRRLDNILFTLYKGLPRSRVYRAIRSGEVRVNGGRIKPDYRLQANDELRLPPLQVKASKPLPTVTLDRQQELLQRVIYEDNDLLVINKPAGMPVHGGSGISGGLIELLRIIRPQSKRLELVHRLDRDTSGCLLVAKKMSTLIALHEVIKAGQMGKHYLALVHGRWPRGVREVNLPLKKNQLSSGERIVKVAKDGKPSRTLFHPLKRFKSATLLHVELDTGRTHQIRVHTQAIGCPIVGDKRYGDKSADKTMRQLGLKRMCLHAAELHIPPFANHPGVALCACLDTDLVNALNALQ